MQVKTNELDDFETIELGRAGAKSVVPADFNGDKKMDLLIVYPDGLKSCTYSFKCLFYIK